MTEASPEFVKWLTMKLTSLDIDDSVYGEYIIGILTEEVDPDESVAEILEETVGGILEEGASDLCNEIMSQWEKMNATESEDLASKDLNAKKENVETLNNLFSNRLTLETQKANKSEAVKEMSDEQRKMKESVMKLYKMQENAEYPFYASFLIV